MHSVCLHHARRCRLPASAESAPDREALGDLGGTARSVHSCWTEGQRLAQEARCVSLISPWTLISQALMASTQRQVSSLSSSPASGAHHSRWVELLSPARLVPRLHSGSGDLWPPAGDDGGGDGLTFCSLGPTAFDRCSCSPRGARVPIQRGSRKPADGSAFALVASSGAPQDKSRCRLRTPARKA